MQPRQLYGLGYTSCEHVGSDSSVLSRLGTTVRWTRRKELLRLTMTEARARTCCSPRTRRSPLVVERPFWRQDPLSAIRQNVGLWQLAGFTAHLTRELPPWLPKVALTLCTLDYGICYFSRFCVDSDGNPQVLVTSVAFSAPTEVSHLSQHLDSIWNTADSSSQVIHTFTRLQPLGSWTARADADCLLDLSLPY